MGNSFHTSPHDSTRQQAPSQAPAGKLRFLRLIGALFVVLFMGKSEPSQPPADRPKSGEFRFSRVVLAFFIILIVGAIDLGLVWYFFTARKQHQQQEQRSQYPLAPATQSDLPAEPRLEQLNPLAESGGERPFARQQADFERLNSRGPTDEPGFVHIPIREAMRLIAKQLPVRTQTETAGAGKNDGLLDAGEPNSGRIFREAQR